MPTPLRRRLRLARRGFGYTVAIVLVFVAVVIGVASQLLPLAERHPERIAAWLSERAGRPVSFDHVQARWTRRGPLLKLDRLRIGEGEQAFTVGDTEMLVSMYSGLLPGQSFSELRLRGLDLTLERASDGRWQVRGLPGQQQEGGDPFAALEGLGELQVVGAKLSVLAPALGIDAQVPKAHLRLRVDGGRVRAGVRAWPHLGAAPLSAVLHFDRHTGDGIAYAGARQVDLAPWSSLLQLHGIAVERGSGRAQAWAHLRGNRVQSVTVDARLDDVSLRGKPIDAGGAAPRSRFSHVETRARWQLVDGGWRADAPRLRIGRDSDEQILDGLLLAGGRQYALQARRIDAGPLLATLALSERLSPGLRRWLQAARPSLTLYDVEIAGRRNGGLRLQGRAEGLAFASVGNAPGLQGLGGEIQGDGQGYRIQLDPSVDVRFAWPAGFGVDHVVRLRGDVGAWREGDGVRVATSALRIEGEDLGVNARGSLWWQGDGSRPWIDLAAEVDETVIPVAKGFWLRKVMSPVTVRWLDTALVAGRLQGGRAVVSGDLDDWPFRDNTGLFEATGHVSDATIRFQEDWPAAQQIEVDTRFTGTGFDIKGTGRLGAVNIRQIHATIDEYAGGSLRIAARGNGDAAQLLDVLKQSPLRKDHADTFANLKVAGPADVTFEFDAPLRERSTISIGGTVAVRNVRLSDARWNLAFDRVNGTARYARGGFAAQGLDVRHGGEPGTLSLRAGPGFVRDATHAFEAGLEANLSAVELIDRAEDLDWLRPYLGGRSNWTIGIAIPQTAPGAPTRALLQLDSNLVGTSLDLPAPLRKAHADSLHASIQAPLPLGSGDILVGLGEVMALRARAANGRTGVRVALGASRVAEAAPESGLVVTGHAGTLEAIDWIALTRGGEGGGGLPLQRIDMTAQRLQLLGGTFENTQVVVAPAENGAIALQALGETLHGALVVPARADEVITGRFQRAYWQPVETPGGAPAAGDDASANAQSQDINPANIPALAIDIDDLHLAGMPLGKAVVRTRPTATGLRIEQLQTRAEKHRIQVAGEWNGTGASARTRLDVEVGSDDFGKLMSGFGFGELLAGGEGTVKFDASWPGSPVAFRLEDLEGALHLDARNGRLLDVEPGAGRVLGLLSLAQLPRRLTLDFRDFFYKGFAFNQIAGNVRFADGRARSDDMMIDGPAATIDISGSADLRAQSYDQTIEVRPKTGNLLTAIGAVAGGPVGAAIGAAANAVFNKPLGSVAAKTYRVTGPWKEPKVEVITREQSRASSADSPPAG